MSDESRAKQSKIKQKSHSTIFHPSNRGITEIEQPLQKTQRDPRQSKRGGLPAHNSASVNRGIAKVFSERMEGNAEGQEFNHPATAIVPQNHYSRKIMCLTQTVEFRVLLSLRSLGAGITRKPSEAAHFAIASGINLGRPLPLSHLDSINCKGCQQTSRRVLTRGKGYPRRRTRSFIISTMR